MAHPANRPHPPRPTTSARPLRAAPIGTLILLAALAQATARAADVSPGLAGAFRPPTNLADDLGSYRSPLVFADGHRVTTAAEWSARRREILDDWRGYLGAWPALIERPKVEVLATEKGEGYARRRVRLPVAPDRTVEGYLVVPDGPGPFPAMVVVFYEPETAVGLGARAGSPLDFARQLAPRGIAALSIGFDPRQVEPRPGDATPPLQPLSYLAYGAANAYNALATLPEVDPTRVGVMGHSYGGKWAMFASCLYEKFACGVWSDPGIVFDESRANVNYWEPWYLGWEPGRTRKPGVVTPANPRTGAYARLIEAGRDLHELHALMAPRPFLVSGGSEDPPERWRALNHARAVNRLLGADDRVAMTNRPGHTPTPEANAQILEFLDHVLKPRPDPARRAAPSPG